MRQYRIEDLYPDALQRIEKALDERGLRGGLEGIYYLPVPPEHLTDIQRQHLDECGPFFLALETTLPPGSKTGCVQMELLVRARNKMRCDCLCYALPALREHMIDYLDDFIRQLDIAV